MLASIDPLTLVNEFQQRASNLADAAIGLGCMFSEAALRDEPVDFAEFLQKLSANIASLENALVSAALQALEPLSEEIVVAGQVYRRLSNTARDRTYVDLRSTPTVSASLYRLVGVRNGPTVVPQEVRAGIVEGRATPRAAVAIARLAQAVPSEEAEALCEAFEALPTSRSSIYRLANLIGQRWEDHRVEGENFLAEEFEIPEEASAVCVAIDRVNLAYSVPRALTPTEQALDKPPRNPIRVEYRQVYVGCITLTDANRTPLHTTRYGRIPDEAGRDLLEEALRFDLLALMEARPDLKVSALGDGATEVQHSLDRVTADIEVDHHGVDVWHALGYINKAADAANKSNEKNELRERLLKQDMGAMSVLMTLLTWALTAEYSEDSEDSSLSGPRLAFDHGVPADSETELATRAQAALRAAKNQLAEDAARLADPDNDHTRSKPPSFGDNVHEDLASGVRYLWNHWERMGYAAAWESGLAIGSGHVEATCKTLVAVRMKRSGARWKDDGAQAILNLRGLATSSRWSLAMKFLLGTYLKPVQQKRTA